MPNLNTEYFLNETIELLKSNINKQVLIQNGIYKTFPLIEFQTNQYIFSYDTIYREALEVPYLVFESDNSSIGKKTQLNNEVVINISLFLATGINEMEQLQRQFNKYNDALQLTLNEINNCFIFQYLKTIEILNKESYSLKGNEGILIYKKQFNIKYAYA